MGRRTRSLGSRTHPRRCVDRNTVGKQATSGLTDGLCFNPTALGGPALGSTMYLTVTATASTLSVRFSIAARTSREVASNILPAATGA